MTTTLADPLSRVFAALADPTRRDIVARLTTSDANVNDLAEPYAMSVQAISKHLKVLEDAGLVRRSRSGQHRPVHLEARGIDEMSLWLECFRMRADERFRRLDRLLTTMPDEPPEPGPSTPTGAR